MTERVTDEQLTEIERRTERAWLTSGQAAKRVGLSVFKLNRYQALGWINPSFTLGGRRRFSMTEIDALIERRQGVS